jgi:hypothetical protein
MASHDAAWPCPKTTDLRVGGPALGSPPRITSKPPAISCGATRQSRSAPPPRSRPRQRAPPRPRPESWARPNREVAAPTDPGASQPVGHAERLLGDGPAVPARNIIFRKAMTPGCWSRAVRSRNRPTMSQRSIKGSHGPDGSDGMHGMTSGCCSAGRRKVGIGRSSPRTNPFRSRLIFIWSCGDLYKRLAASCVVFRMGDQTFVVTLRAGR